MLRNQFLSWSRLVASGQCKGGAIEVLRKGLHSNRSQLKDNNYRESGHCQVFRESSTKATQSDMSVEEAKRLAARAAVDNHVDSSVRVVGVGSGSTIVYAVQRLEERAKQEGLDFVCVPTSFQARQLVLNAGLNLSDLETEPSIDVTIDGCDECDPSLVLIKGGGGCMTQEKLVAEYSNSFVVVADYRKKVERLGTQWDYIPLEVLPMAYKPVTNRIQEKLGGTARLRMAKSKAGPVVTDNGGLVLDWYWDKEGLAGREWAQVEQELRGMVGIVETGLFVGMAYKAYFGMEDGSVEEMG